MINSVQMNFIKWSRYDTRYFIDPGALSSFVENALRANVWWCIYCTNLLRRPIIHLSKFLAAINLRHRDIKPGLSSLVKS